jgi:hypothetical protein
MFKTTESQRDARKRYYRKHKKEEIERSKKYTQKHKKSHNKSNKKYRGKHKEQHSEYCKIYFRELKRKVFVKLGNKCMNPYNLAHGDFLNDIRCLQIDHVHGHGTKERKKHSSSKFLAKVLADTKGNYQLLCSNCNWIKRFENGETR